MNENIKENKNVARALGITFLLCFVASLVSGTALLESRVWNEGIIENLKNIAQNSLLMRVNIIGEFITGSTIIILASIFFSMFYKKHKIVATVAFGFWLTEAMTLIISKLFTFSLWQLSIEFVEGGAPIDAHYQSLGELLFRASEYGYAIHMLFFSFGAVLWYYLVFKERLLPKGISIWSLVGIILILVNSILEIYNPSFGKIYLLVVYAPFELFIGFWLVIVGFRKEQNLY